MNDFSMLAIIPARGGSKRLPGKNIKLLNGKPLIAFTIEAALESNLFAKVCVSTDDAEIARVAKAYGAEVPFIRPAELSSDHATSIDVVKHVLRFYKNEEATDFSTTVLLQPTSPLRSSTDIKSAYEFFEDRNANSVISVCEMDHSPLWSNTLPPDYSMERFIKPELKNIRSQDLPKYYRINGAIYINRTQNLISENSFISIEKCFAYVMTQENSVDIDTELDFKIAEAITQQR